MITIFFYLYERFFESNWNFTTEHEKIVIIQGFLSYFCSKLQVFQGSFCLNCQIPGFSRIPGKVATLINRLESKLVFIQKNW